MEEAANLALLTSIARSEGLNRGKPSKIFYNPIYKHPLPISDHRYDYENNLRRILSCSVPFQGMAAITKGDAWSLEEVFLRNGRACLSDRDGVSPLHIAVQLNQVECVQVLLNIGVDVNQPNQYGYPPLSVARSNGYIQIEQLLIKQGAKAVIKVSDEAPSTTNLEVYPEQNYGKVRQNVLLMKDSDKIARSSRYY
jgi:ankyrin repeat protein